MMSSFQTRNLLLKVALGQKIPESFYISNVKIPSDHTYSSCYHFGDKELKGLIEFEKTLFMDGS